MTTIGQHASGRGTGRRVTGRDRGRASRRRWTISLLVVVGGLALAACSGNGDVGGALEGSLPDVTLGSGTGVIGDGSNLPEVTLPATGDTDGSAAEGDVGGQTDGEDAMTEADADVEPIAPPVLVVGDLDEGAEDGLTTEQWVLIVIIAVVVIAVIAGGAALMSGRSNDHRQQQARTQQRRDQIVGGCRWAHDQAALTVLSTNDPAMLRSTWTTIERQLLDLESSIATAQAEADGGVDPDVAAAGRAVAAVRSALAADVTVRSSSSSPAAEMVAQSRQTVLDRNRDLEAATARLDAARV